MTHPKARPSALVRALLTSCQPEIDAAVVATEAQRTELLRFTVSEADWAELSAHFAAMNAPEEVAKRSVRLRRYGQCRRAAERGRPMLPRIGR